VLDPLVYRIIFKSLKLGGLLLRALELLTVGWNALVKGAFFCYNRRFKRLVKGFYKGCYL